MLGHYFTPIKSESLWGGFQAFFKASQVVVTWSGLAVTILTCIGDVELWIQRQCCYLVGTSYMTLGCRDGCRDVDRPGVI